MAHPYRTTAGQSETKGLGALRSLHRGSYRGVWTAGIALTLVGAVVSLSRVGPRAFLFLIPGVAVVMAIGALLVPRGVALHEEGVELRRWLRSPLRLRFDDCRSVFREISTLAGRIATGYAIRLVDAEGRSLRITPLVADGKTLMEAIEAECVRPVKRDAFAAFDAGEELTFGPVTVDRSGLTVDGLPYEWSVIESVEVSLAKVRVQTTTGPRPRALDLDDLPYPFVFLSLLQRAGASLTGGTVIIPTG